MTNPQHHRTNLNLRIEDVAWLQHTYGYGWTEQARELLHQRIEQIKAKRQDLTDETNLDSGTNPKEAN
jgi:hypothetical protein